MRNHACNLIVHWKEKTKKTGYVYKIVYPKWFLVNLHIHIWLLFFFNLRYGVHMVHIMASLCWLTSHNYTLLECQQLWYCFTTAEKLWLPYMNDWFVLYPGFVANNEIIPFNRNHHQCSPTKKLPTTPNSELFCSFFCLFVFWGFFFHVTQVACIWFLASIL